MKISIITVCRDEEKRIEKTLTSVKNQTYKNIEHLFIDGLSTDKTTDIIHQYKPDYFISEADKGIYHAMNKGIAKSSGDMLLFLNAGDYLAADDVVELAINELNSDTDIFFGRLFLLNPKTQSSELTKYLDISKKFFMRCTLPHPATLTKRVLFDEIGFFNEDFKIAADREFFVKAFIQDKIFQPSNIAMSYFELGGISETDNITCKYENSIILKKYLSFYLTSVSKQKIDVLFDKEKTATLKELSEIYNDITADMKPVVLKFLREYIRNNIALIDYKFDSVRIILWLYCFRYKAKAFLKWKKGALPLFPSLMV